MPATQARLCRLIRIVCRAACSFLENKKPAGGVKSQSRLFPSANPTTAAQLRARRGNPAVLRKERSDDTISSGSCRREGRFPAKAGSFETIRDNEGTGRKLSGTQSAAQIFFFTEFSLAVLHVKREVRVYLSPDSFSKTNSKAGHVFQKAYFHLEAAKQFIVLSYL